MIFLSLNKYHWLGRGSLGEVCMVDQHEVVVTRVVAIHICVPWFTALVLCKAVAKRHSQLKPTRQVVLFSNMWLRMVSCELAWQGLDLPVQSTLSKADTLGTKATVRFREVSALERVPLLRYKCNSAGSGPNLLSGLESVRLERVDCIVWPPADASVDFVTWVELGVPFEQGLKLEAAEVWTDCGYQGIGGGGYSSRHI